MSRIAGMSAELEHLQRRIERWRMSRVRQGRMPEPLWAAAVEVAAQHGVGRVASALGLGYAGLKQRVEAAAPRRRVPEAEEAKSGFGEGSATAVLAASGQHHHRVRRAGRLAVESHTPHRQQRGHPRASARIAWRMIQITPQMRVLVAIEPADFRRGMDGLAQQCRAALCENPFTGAVFVFRNRQRTAVNVLVYDGQGFWLCHKRPSQGRFGGSPRRKRPRPLLCALTNCRCCYAEETRRPPRPLRSGGR